MNEQLNTESNEALKEESIEILELDDDSMEKVTVRKSFRIPVREKSSYSIRIGETLFPIEDLNVEGAGVSMIEDRSFFKGQVLSGCVLTLGSTTFDNVECQIVHITSVKDAPPLIGLKWLNINSDSSGAGMKRIEEICDELKKDLLDDSRQ